MASVGDEFSNTAHRYPDSVALFFEGASHTFREVDAASTEVARQLVGAGVGPGARLAYLGVDSAAFHVSMLGVAKAGAVFVPLNWRLATAEITSILADLDPDLVLVDDRVRASLGAGFTAPERSRVVAVEPHLVDDLGAALPGDGGDGDAVRELPQVSDDDPFAIFYTSGTSGRPKGVVLPHRSFSAVRSALAAIGSDWIEWTPQDRNLLCLPGFHVGGLWGALQAFAFGATNVVMARFSATDALESIGGQGITTVCAVPAMLQAIVAESGFASESFAGLRRTYYGGSPIGPEVLESLVSLMGCEFVQVYGLTETGNTVTCLTAADHRAGGELLETVGRPYPGFDVAVVDGAGERVPARGLGEVLLSTPARMLEYWGRPDATATTLRDGWIWTGDCGYLDDAGYLHLVGRLSEMIVVAGENVFPGEVERLLIEHASVREVAAFGVSDPDAGEVVRCAVVLDSGADVTPWGLATVLRGKIAPYKVPVGYDFVNELPRNQSGKVMRGELRARHEASAKYAPGATV